MGFITGGPTEAIIVSGCFHRKPLIVVSRNEERGNRMEQKKISSPTRFPLAFSKAALKALEVYYRVVQQIQGLIRLVEEKLFGLEFETRKFQL